MRKIKQRVFTLVITMLLVLSLVESDDYVNAEVDVSSEVSEKEEGTDYSKLHFYYENEEHYTIDDKDELQEAVELCTMETNMSMYSLAARSQSREEVRITIGFDSNFMDTKQFKYFSTQREKMNGIEEIHALREQLSKYSKKYHQNLIKNNMDTLSALNYNECEAVQYSPYVVLTMDSSQLDVETLTNLIEYDEVETVSLSYEVEPVSTVSWNDTLSEIGAYEIVSNSEYVGEGVRIGVYESGGVCNPSHVNLSGKDITIKDSSNKYTSHATNVTSILAKIAPSAEFYVSEVDQIGIGWFIEQNCDIVNCSFGYFNNSQNEDGTYTDGAKQYRYDIDAIYDYQIRTSFITVVVAAGNNCSDNTRSAYNPNNKVTSPGYAYNAITVGGVKRTWSWFEYYLEHDDGASYVSSSPNVKPNVSAIYTVSIPNVGSGSGTSYAAPQVAGSVALLLERDLRYCMYPDRILSVVTSTAKKTHDYVTDKGSFDNRVGAGVIDLEKMIDNTLPKTTYNINKTAKKTILTVEANLPKQTDIRISLAWLINARNTSTSEDGISISNIYVTDYDLRVYNPSGELVKSSALVNSNVEMVDYTTEEAGLYKFVVYQFGTQDANNSADWLSVSYAY